MIKSALEYIIGLSRPNTEAVNGEIYSDKPLHRIPKTSQTSM